MRAILAACLLCLSAAAFAGQLSVYSPDLAVMLAGANSPAFADFSLAAQPRDNAKELKWNQLAAQQGQAFAQYNLGTMYQQGLGVPVNYTKAVKWLRLAADHGFALAQAKLGGMYELGQGVPQDYAKALKWNRLAAQQGNSIAQVNLGFAYGEGQGAPQNYVAAYKWNETAKGATKPASKTYKVASENMAILSRTMTTAQIAQAQQEASAWRAVHHKGS